MRSFFGSCASQDLEISNCSRATPNPRSLNLVEGTLFELKIVEHSNEFLSGEEIVFQVENISDHEIWFPPDLNLTIMHRASENSTTFFPLVSSSFSNKNIVLGNDQKSNRFYTFSIIPNIPVMKTLLNLRFLLPGTFIKTLIFVMIDIEQWLC